MRRGARDRGGTAAALAAALAITVAGACSGAQRPPAAKAGDAAELRRITQEMMDAVAPGDAAVWRKYLHERVLYVDENGAVHPKADILRELTPLPPGLVGRIAVDVFEAEVHGDVAAVAYEVQETLDYHGQPLRTRFRTAASWLRTPDGWRLILSHTSAVLKDPPAAELSREQLCAYAGRYALTDAIVTTVRCIDGALVAERPDRPAVTWLPEVADVFFVKGQPRTRRIFLRDRSGNPVGFVDRREGEDIRWRRIDR
jgi:hypothetical protein